jgi:hypothetical protein
MLVVKRWRISTSELNETTNISSCGDNARAISRTVCSACCSLCRMLPLESIRTPTLMGTRRSCEKNEIFCSWPSSNTLKSSSFKPSMYFPCSSRTVAVTFTNSTFTFRRYRGSCDGSCAASGGGGGAAGAAVSAGAFCGSCAASKNPAQSTQKRRPIVAIERFFRAFMVSHPSRANIAAVYSICLMLRTHFIPGRAENCQRFSQCPSRTAFRFQFGM